MFVILDFGSQLTQLIARRLRELNFYSEIHPYNVSLDKIKSLNPAGIILSGGPSSVYEDGAPYRNIGELLKVAPLLGVCYGMQIVVHDLGGTVEKSNHREYGSSEVEWQESFSAKSVQGKQKVWMSHGDIVTKLPEGFRTSAISQNGIIAGIKSDRVWAVQFHPEVAHTENGSDILKAFAEDLCKVDANWNAPKIVETLKKNILEKVKPDEHILCALSGGVDSTVVAVLLTRTLGAERVHCIFVDNGLLRKNEFENVLNQYKNLGLNIKAVDAKDQFLGELKGVSDPEQKRKIIGRVFIEVFEQQIDKKIPIRYLAQGTLYPDVIESVSFKGGPSHTIKSHHNVGGLPEKMNLKLIEPVRELFKDEVRKIGIEMGLAEELVWRHPFPGPGLAIRVLGEITEEKLKILREADHVFINKLREKNLYHKIWQAGCMILPVRTVGVMGDGRTYHYVLALRAVTSTDGMTADWYPFSYEFLREVSNEITNKVAGVNRVVYDVTSKPPATIEWE